MRNLLRRRRLIALGGTVIALGVAALVYAAWLAGGTGSGYAKAKSAQQLTTVDVSASTSATLYPGADGDVLIKITNPNPYPVRVTGVAGNGAITADSGHSSCSTTGVTYTNQSGLTIDVAASSSTQATLSNAAHMSNSSDDGCQGAVFTIPVSLTGQSNAP